MGISEYTVGKVVLDWKKCNDGTFMPHKTLGRPKSQSNENVSELLRVKILNANKTAEQIFTSILCQYLSEQGYTFLNGSFFSYYIIWDIIMVKENEEIFFMNL